MIIKVLTVLFFSIGSLLAQSTTIFINDNKGNQAVARVSAGHLYFRDNSGNVAIGTLQDGNVFLNTSNGETIFGSIKNGNVNLTDKKGVTTGTIKNGNIFLNNSDGSVTVGTYDKFGNSFTNTTVPPYQTTQQSNAQLQQQIQQNNANAYAAGYAMGSGITNAIIIGAERHKMKSFCKANPTAIFIAKANAFSGTLCKNAPFNQAQQEHIDSYCEDNPGHETGYGLHMVTCFVPPPIPNLKWAKWEMDGLHKDYEAQLSLNINSIGASQSRDSWTAWKTTYCGLAKKGASYKNLDGKKQHCS